MKRIVLVALPLALLAVFAIVSSGCSEDHRKDCVWLGKALPGDESQWPCEPVIGDGGTGGEGGGTPDGCVPADETVPVEESCGVFVSSSLGVAGDADGSMAKPYASISEALAGLGDATDVYLCGEDFNESVLLAAGVSVYGGLDCSNAAMPWLYDSTKRTRLLGAPDQIALKVSGAGTSAVEDVDVTAPNAEAAGGSSIAVLVDGVAVDFARCDFAAGDGVAGVDGEVALGPEGAADGGNDGTAACDGGTQILGGAGKTNEACVSSAGGSGGLGNQDVNGGNGAKGEPGDLENGGAGGDGVQACAAGLNGDSGTTTTPATPSTLPGTLTPTGYTPPTPANGAAGLPGQGGGGGGGSKGGMNVCSNMPGAGASGGSGGPGGCGGLGGNGGLGGGSSIALVSIDAAIDLLECNLTSGVGANGGAGMDGQAGQNGGDGGIGGGDGPAPATNPGCNGGKGGSGGNGAPGAGGLGGHSLGIAFIGDAPKHESGDNTPGTAGDGGTSSGNSGNSGTSAKMQSFEQP